MAGLSSATRPTGRRTDAGSASGSMRLPPPPSLHSRLPTRQLPRPGMEDSCSHLHPSRVLAVSLLHFAVQVPHRTMKERWLARVFAAR